MLTSVKRNYHLELTCSQINPEKYSIKFMHWNLYGIAFITTLSPSGNVFGVIDFEKQVLPILEARCIECHKAPYELNGRVKEPKAGLRLDGAKHIMAGSDDGSVVVVDHPSQSSLYQRVILSSTDDDIMPPKGDPLTFTEQELIRKWIGQGVDFGTWLGAEEGVRSPISDTNGVNNDLPDYLRFYDQLALGVIPIKAPRLRTMDLELGESLLIRPIGIGNSLIEVKAVTDADQIDDQLVAQLTYLQNHISLLDLRGSMITNKSCEVISKFKKITKLNIRGTQVGDNGIKHLLKLPNLQSLNLSQTSVTDEGIKLLQSHSSLTSLHLWGSKVSENGISRFSKEDPSVELTF